jgi:hypothetical protein
VSTKSSENLISTILIAGNTPTKKQYLKSMVNFGRNNRPLPPSGEGGSDQQQQSVASLSELNGLLESALRMSGGGEDAASLLGGTTAPTSKYAATANNDSNEPSTTTSCSWRLDTMRKLTAVSI